MDEKTFYEIILKTLMCLSPKDLARRLRVSSVTIERWRDRKNAPLPYMREYIVGLIAKDNSGES